MENKNFYVKNLSQLNFLNNINLNNAIIYASSYKNMILFLINNNILYKGKYFDELNSENFVFEKIDSNINKNNILALKQKFIQCDFTLNYIYFITQNKNEILFSKYFNYENNNEILSILPGILQKKKNKINFLWIKYNFIFNIWWNGIC